MKNSKLRKLLSLLLAVLMLASLLTACSEEDDDDDDRPRKKKSKETTAATELTEPTGETFDDEPTIEATFPEPTDDPYSEDDRNEIASGTTTNSVAFGEINGSTYTNTYAGFGCTLDSSWIFKSAKELQDLTGYVTGELFDGTQFENLTAKYPQFTDMLAENTNELVTINVLFQKLDAATAKVYSSLTEEQLIDIMLLQSETLKQTYSQMGITVETLEKVNVTFLGKPRTAIAMTATMQGLPYYTLQLFDYKDGSYSIYLTLASFNENKTMDMLDLFFVVD